MPPIHGKLVQEGPQHGAQRFALPWDVGGMGASLEPRSAGWRPLAPLLEGFTAARRLMGWALPSPVAPRLQPALQGDACPVKHFSSFLVAMDCKDWS